MGSVLPARALLPRAGGTLLAIMALAYEAPSPHLQQTLDGLKAVHCTAHVPSAEGA